MTAHLLALGLALGAGGPKIATLQLEASGVPPETAEAATLLVPTEVRRLRPDAQVVSSDDVRSLLTLQRNQMVLGCGADPRCMKDIGGALGADEIVGGRLGRLGGTFVLEMRRLDVAKARNLASVTRTVRSADALVAAVRSATAALFEGSPGSGAAPAAPSAVLDPGSPPPVALYAAPGDDESLPRPSLVEGDLDFKPIPYRGVGNRAVYDVVRAYLAGAQVPIEKESTEDDALLRLRSGWMKIEKGRRLRFRVRVDGQVALEVDREACDSRGCAETWDVSGGELKLATDVYAVLRGPVEKGTF